MKHLTQNLLGGLLTLPWLLTRTVWLALWSGSEHLGRWVEWSLITTLDALHRFGNLLNRQSVVLDSGERLHLNPVLNYQHLTRNVVIGLGDSISAAEATGVVTYLTEAGYFRQVRYRADQVLNLVDPHPDTVRMVFDQASEFGDPVSFSVAVGGVQRVYYLRDLPPPIV
jgi:hypothetical protein